MRQMGSWLYADLPSKLPAIWLIFAEVTVTEFTLRWSKVSGSPLNYLLYALPVIVAFPWVVNRLSVTRMRRLQGNAIDTESYDRLKTNASSNTTAIYATLVMIFGILNLTLVLRG